MDMVGFFILCHESILLIPHQQKKRISTGSVWAHILTSNHAKHKHTFAELSGPFYPQTFGAQWVKDLSEVNWEPWWLIAQHQITKLARAQSWCFVRQSTPVVITLICGVLKSSQGRFVYSLWRLQNMLQSICRQDWDAADNSGSARISLWRSCN